MENECRLESIARAVRDGHMHASSQVYTRFLEMFGLVACAWALLEAACIAERRLATREVAAEPAEAAFYRGKVKAARYQSLIHLSEPTRPLYSG